MNKGNLVKILDFLHLIGKLKTTYRFGADPDIDGDSSADHSWRLALMVFMLAEELKLHINIERALKLALVHDLAEAITGDIDARHIKEKKYSKEEKDNGELLAMKKICDCLPEDLGIEINDLWMEYEKAQTQEARYVKALDKIETQIQTLDFGREKIDDPQLIGIYGIKEVENFPELRNLLRLVKNELKKEFAGGNFVWKDKYDI